MFHPEVSRIENAANYCAQMLPEYDVEAVNPLVALETGRANCAVRAFLMATVLGSCTSRVGFFIHKSHGKTIDKNGNVAMGHVVTLCGQNVVNTTYDPKQFSVAHISQPTTFYDGGCMILDDPALGIITYAKMHPKVPNIGSDDVLIAQEIILQDARA